jgi:MYXO-CTERM domain-containing protein
VDTLNHTIYGHVTSLSPFGVFEPSGAVIPAPGALVLSGIGLAVLRRMRRRLA